MNGTHREGETKKGNENAPLNEQLFNSQGKITTENFEGVGLQVAREETAAFVLRTGGGGQCCGSRASPGW